MDKSKDINKIDISKETKGGGKGASKMAKKKTQTVKAITILVTFGFIIAFGALIVPSDPSTNIHVLVGKTTIQEYYIANVWVEDGRDPIILRFTKKDISALNYFEIEIVEDVNGKLGGEVWNKTVGLKSPYGEHVIKWDKPLPGDYFMTVRLKQGTKEISEKTLHVTYPLGE